MPLIDRHVDRMRDAGIREQLGVNIGNSQLEHLRFTERRPGSENITGGGRLIARQPNSRLNRGRIADVNRAADLNRVRGVLETGEAGWSIGYQPVLWDNFLELADARPRESNSARAGVFRILQPDSVGLSGDQVDLATR